MAAQLAFGTVPPFYRELFDTICGGQEKIDFETFQTLLGKSGLARQNLSTIWELTDPQKNGYLTRDGLYKAFALIALSQQGKTVSEKSLELLIDSDLPKPNLGDLAELKSLKIKLKRTKNPNVLGFSYPELLELDRIEVELEPDKKGLILKHREYTVSSRKHNTSVQRRYNDFVSFHELLMSRFLYRLIPKLPPKKIGASKEFIEARRRALKRFMMLVVRHPVMSNDPIVTYFMTFKGSDVGHKIKEHFKGAPDEFLTNSLASQAKELVPADTQVCLSSSRQQIQNIHVSVHKMKEMMDRLSLRSLGMGGDMYSFSKELVCLANDQHGATSWATGGNDTWDKLKKGFRSLSKPFGSLAEKGVVFGEKEEDQVSDYLATFLDLTTGYKELLERHEKGVLRDHQLALHRMQQYKQKRMSATVKGMEDAADQLEHRIVEQEDAIHTMENRNYFSLYCLQMETQLIHANMEMLANMLRNLTDLQIKKHNELSLIWQEMKTTVDSTLPAELSPSGTPIRAGSPPF
ncbi:sorting nexin-8-like [Rhopilema esculentum]|uniref:sorting nexin-8-like n=1 Tax=Rhopilema esculentum TaxID=499914 RepID=UPI0031D74245|eukprot:gene9535-17281_t